MIAVTATAACRLSWIKYKQGETLHLLESSPRTQSWLTRLPFLWCCVFFSKAFRCDEERTTAKVGIQNSSKFLDSGSRQLSPGLAGMTLK